MSSKGKKSQVDLALLPGARAEALVDQIDRRFVFAVQEPASQSSKDAKKWLFQVSSASYGDSLKARNTNDMNEWIDTINNLTASRHVSPPTPFNSLRTLLNTKYSNWRHDQKQQRLKQLLHRVRIPSKKHSIVVVEAGPPIQFDVPPPSGSEDDSAIGGEDPTAFSVRKGRRE